MLAATASGAPERWIASHGGIGVPDRAMAPNPNIAPVLFDRALLRARQSRALRAGPAAFLLDRATEDMAERLHAVLREFKNAADVGTPSDLVSNVLQEHIDQLARIELPDLESEPLPFKAESLDLVVSALAFQFVNDLPGVLAQIRRALKPDGLLLAAMIGGETLTELRQSFAAAEAECEGGVSPRVAPFADVRELGGLLQRAGFAVEEVEILDVDPHVGAVHVGDAGFEFVHGVQGVHERFCSCATIRATMVMASTAVAINRAPAQARRRQS